MLFITEALAQEATPTDMGDQASIGSNLSSFIPLVLIFLVFYFLLIRPQQKKMREHHKMVESLKRGDKVVAAGGILGAITKVEADAGIVQVEIAPDIKIRVRKDAVTEVLNRPEVANDAPAKADKK